MKNDKDASGIMEYTDALSRRDDVFVNSLNPVVKLMVTVLYLIFMTSMSKYMLSGVILGAAYPVIMLRISQIPLGKSLHKLWGLFPVICLVGIANPFYDRSVMMYVGGFAVTGGMISAAVFALKGISCVLSVFVLACTTGIGDICAALGKLHVPSELICMFLLMYRYLYVINDELRQMKEAYLMRAPSHKGIVMKAWGSMVGMFFLRCMERAQSVYDSMLLRGYDASKGIGAYSKKPCKFGRGDMRYIVLSVLYMVFSRFEGLFL